MEITAQWACDAPMKWALKEKNIKWQCTHCKSDFVFPVAPFENKHYFCPCCGAKMTGYAEKESDGKSPFGG